jgi:tetratricopeptide (TPR) repeat protein
MRTILTVLVSCKMACLMAEPMGLSPSMFRSDDFKQRFVGSYGMLPTVDPKVDRDEAELIAELGDLLGQGGFQKAEDRLVEFINERKSPSDPAVEAKEVSAALIFTLGNLYFQSGRLSEAERCYKLAIQRHPDYRRALKNLALLYAQQDRIADAKPLLMKAIELGEADHRAFGLLGYAYMKEDMALAAECAYRQAYLLKSDEKDWQLGLAQALLMQEKWAESASMLQSLIDQSPDNALLWKQQANCHLQMEEPLRAAENYEVLRLMGLADEESLNQLGDIYANQEQPLLALGAYLSATQLSDVVNVERSLKSAKYLHTLGATGEAARFIAALKEKAGDHMTDEQKGRLLVVESDVARSEGRLAEAGDLLKRLLEFDAANGEARERLGQIHVQLAEEATEEALAKEFQLEARKYFLIAMKDPQNEVAYKANLGYGQMLVKDSRFVDALPPLEKALQLKNSQNLEQYVRRVQRAAEREAAKTERLEVERDEKLEEARKAAQKAGSALKEEGAAE